MESTDQQKRGTDKIHKPMQKSHRVKHARDTGTEERRATEKEEL